MWRRATSLLWYQLFMLIAALALILVAMLLGSILLSGRGIGWPLRIAHGAPGAAGLALMVFALTSGSFHGAVANDAILLAASGLVLGLFLAWSAWFHKRPPTAIVFLHATLGGLGGLLLAGFLLG